MHSWSATEGDNRNPGGVDSRAERGEVMDEIKKRLERELSHTMDRIRRMGGGVVFEDFPVAALASPF